MRKTQAKTTFPRLVNSQSWWQLRYPTCVLLVAKSGSGLEFGRIPHSLENIFWKLKKIEKNYKLPLPQFQRPQTLYFFVRHCSLVLPFGKELWTTLRPRKITVVFPFVRAHKFINYKQHYAQVCHHQGHLEISGNWFWHHFTNKFGCSLGYMRLKQLVHPIKLNINIQT